MNDQAKIFFAIPIDSGSEAEFFFSFVRVVQRGSLDIATKVTLGDSLVPRARNQLTADFLESDCTHLLFIDSDQAFTPDDIERLLSHGLPIVGGVVPLKTQGELRWAVNPFEPPAPIDERGLTHVRYIGCGCMLIERAVFERMREAMEDEWYPCDRTGRKEWEFWPIGIYRFPDGTRRYLSEDWYFCQRANDLGFQVIADTKTALRHIGKVSFPLLSQQAA